MRPSVITAVESTGARLFAKSIVVTVSIPSPANFAGRQTSRHCTSGRGARFPTRYVGSHAVTRDDETTARFRACAAAGVGTPGVDGVTYGSATGSDVDDTSRTVLPTIRAAT